MFSNLFKCGNLYSPTIVQINLGSVLPCEKQRPLWVDFTEIFGASVHQCRYREFRTRPTHKDWVSIKFNKESKKMCHLHNEFIYQFVECPNCKSNVCLDNQGSESISNHNFCKFCGILFVSSAKLARTSQNNNKKIEGYTRFDRYLQSY